MGSEKGTISLPAEYWAQLHRLYETEGITKSGAVRVALEKCGYVKKVKPNG